MNSQILLTAAKLRRTFLITALILCPILASVTGNAQTSIATATLTSGGLTGITLMGNTSGQSFVLTLGVTTNFISSGYTVFYQSQNGNNIFSLAAARTNLSPVFTDATTPDAVLFSGTNPRLNPSNANDAGYTGDTVNNQAAGTFNLQSINVSILANLAPGTYRIFLDNRSIMTDHSTPSTFNDVNMGGPNGPFFTVTVAVPEPTTVALAIGGGALLLVAAWKKRARA